MSFFDQNVLTLPRLMTACRDSVSLRIYCEDKHSFLQDCDDDGETAAGGRLLHLLQVIILLNKCSFLLHTKLCVIWVKIPTEPGNYSVLKETKLLLSIDITFTLLTLLAALSFLFAFACLIGVFSKLPCSFSQPV